MGPQDIQTKIEEYPESQSLDALIGLTPCQHFFKKEHLWAIEAARAAGRPLLLKGEPGIGKSQLARAAAQYLNRALLSHVVQSRCESQDLLWHFDAVARLAEAQLYGQQKADNIRELLAMKNFIHPGLLWWAFDYQKAAQQQAIYQYPQESFSQENIEVLIKEKKLERPGFYPKDWKPDDGYVVLIDEIDKGESDVPNGLLEVLANNQFLVPPLHKTVGLEAETLPLVIFTSNDERQLPAAFERRCFVVNLHLPDHISFTSELNRDQQKNDFINYLTNIAEVHFGESIDPKLSDTLATDLYQIRQKVQPQDPKPGQAEYLDILRALREMTDTIQDATQRYKKQAVIMDEVKDFALEKHLAS